MSDSLSIEPDTVVLSRRMRGVRTAIVALTIALAVVSFASYINSHARYRVIGKTDPATGYHIEYTLSSRYRVTTDKKLLESIPILVDAQMLAPPGPPIPIQWIETNLLHTPAVNGQNFRGDAIGQVTSTIPVSNPAGLNSHLPPALGQFEKQNSAGMEVRGCHTFEFTSDYPDPVKPGQVDRYILICVSTPDGREQFTFEGDESRDNPSGVLLEMRRIKDSIRVLKSGRHG